MQHILEIEKKTEPEGEISCLKWTKDDGRRKVCVNFKIDTKKLNFVMYRYRDNLNFKGNEVDRS